MISYFFLFLFLRVHLTFFIRPLWKYLIGYTSVVLFTLLFWQISWTIPFDCSLVGLIHYSSFMHPTQVRFFLGGEILIASIQFFFFFFLIGKPLLPLFLFWMYLGFVEVFCSLPFLSFYSSPHSPIRALFWHGVILVTAVGQHLLDLKLDSLGLNQPTPIYRRAYPPPPPTATPLPSSPSPTHPSLMRESIFFNFFPIFRLTFISHVYLLFFQGSDIYFEIPDQNQEEMTYSSGIVTFLEKYYYKYGLVIVYSVLLVVATTTNDQNIGHHGFFIFYFSPTPLHLSSIFQHRDRTVQHEHPNKRD